MRFPLCFGAALAALVLTISGATLAEEAGTAPPVPRIINPNDAKPDHPAEVQPQAVAPAPAPAVAAEATAPVPAAPVPGETTIGKTVAPAPKPQTAVLINVDLSSQRMTVSENGNAKYTWPISSGRSGYRTPTGSFRPQWMAKMWHSRKYDNAPMPNAIFFTGGFAIHATYATGMLGRPASHGCVRLAPGNAAALFKLVQRHGMDRTKIVVHGSPKFAPEVASRDERRRVRIDGTAYGAPGYRYAATPQGGGLFSKIFGDDEPRRVVYVQPGSRYGMAQRPIYGYTADGRLVRLR